MQNNMLIKMLGAVIKQSTQEFHILKPNGVKCEKEIETLNYIEYALKEGMNPLCILDDGSMMMVGGYTTLFVDMLDRTSSQPELNRLLWDSLKKEHLDKLSIEQNKFILIDLSAYKNNYLEKLFEKGLRVQQGVTVDDSVEIDMANSNNLEFFQLLTKYQPEFKFSKTYRDYMEFVTISQYIRDVNPDTNKYEDLLDFLEKQEIREQLQKDLPTNASSTKMKI